MQTFLFQTAVQAAIIALLWVLVARDAAAQRDRHGASPAGISPFAWGALCGLTWVALIPYLTRRTHAAGAQPPGRERNLLRWWVVLAGLAAIWSAGNATQGDANNAAQHGLLAATFATCALIARARDRALPDRQPRTADN